MILLPYANGTLISHVSSDDYFDGTTEIEEAIIALPESQST
jgi:hypothetical protein